MQQIVFVAQSGQLGVNDIHCFEVGFIIDQLQSELICSACLDCSSVEKVVVCFISKRRDEDRRVSSRVSAAVLRTEWRRFG